MSDLISKLSEQQSITATSNTRTSKTVKIPVMDGTTERLPSAQPERKTGKWIPHIEKSREYIGTVLVYVEYDYWFCDTCGYRVENGQPTYNFCPNCGAKMEGEEA